MITRLGILLGVRYSNCNAQKVSPDLAGLYELGLLFLNARHASIRICGRTGISGYTRNIDGSAICSCFVVTCMNNVRNIFPYVRDVQMNFSMHTPNDGECIKACRLIQLSSYQMLWLLQSRTTFVFFSKA